MKKANWMNVAKFIAKYEKDDKRICDTCDCLYISPDGTVEFCTKNKFGGPFSGMDSVYVEQRLSGEKMYCKEYHKIVDMVAIAKAEKIKKLERCSCGSLNTEQISPGGYRPADASRKHQEIDTDGEFQCNDCGRTWWA
jgi:hypothetical protein